MKRLATSYLASVCLSAVAADAGIAPLAPIAPAPAPNILPDLTATAAVAPKAPRASGVAGVVRADIPVPPPAKRGSGSNGIGTTKYPFEGLEVGQSFAVIGKDAKGMQSTVFSAMERFGTKAPDFRPDGTPRMIKTRGGKTVHANKLSKTRVFTVADVNPATDPDGNGPNGSNVGKTISAMCRVWRTA